MLGATTYLEPVEEQGGGFVYWPKSHHGVHDFFHKFPDQLDRLREEPDLMGAATEEILRWASPQIHFRRTAVCNTELAGVPISAGDKVVMWYASANRDDDIYPDSDQFRLDRESPRPHLSFSAGSHLCVGAGLARMVGRVVTLAYQKPSIY